MINGIMENTSQHDAKYKRWKLFNRKPHINLPEIVRSINLLDPYLSARLFKSDEDNVIRITAISCCFAPDDAGIVGTVSTFPHYINDEAQRRIPSAYVSVWNVDEDECENNGILYTYSPVPTPTFSFCGNMFCCVMNGFQGQLTVLRYEIEEDEKYYDTYPLRVKGGNLCGKTLCVVVSHEFAVTVTNMRMQSDLEFCNFTVWNVRENILLKHRWTKRVYDMFVNRLSGVFLREAIFSPDSKYFGLLTSTNHFILINIMRESCELVKDLLTFSNHTVFSFSFDPTFSHQIIAFATLHNICVVNIYEKGTNIATFNAQQENGLINQISFSKDGSYIGACLDNGKTLIFSNNASYSLLHVLCPKNSPEALPEFYHMNLSANFISFSSSSEEACIAYNNGFVCIWQLPRELKLKNICRLKILSLYPRHIIDTFDIPKTLKLFLKFEI